MKNHELLDLLGDVNEDYVLEAGNNVVKPRFRWKTLAACAACAALVLGASYPAYMAAHPALHGYTVMEGGSMATLDDVKAPAGEIDIPGQVTPAPNPNIDGILNSDDPVRGEGPQPGGAYIGDAPISEAAADQYDRLLRGMGMHGEGAASYPDWFAGAWIDTSCYYDSPAVLTVAIVGDVRDAKLEDQIRGWCGAGVVFEYAKYSHTYLDGLMEQVVSLLDGTGLNCGIGVDVTANCLGVDVYSGGQTIPDRILAELARLDPEGDAIRVRLFTGKLDTLTDQEIKGPARAPADPEARETPAGEPTPTPVENGEPVPGGAQTKGGDTQAKEEGKPAHYDLFPLDE